MIAGQNGVVSYLDDLLVFGKTRGEHDASLRCLLHKIREYGFTLKFKKCVILAERLTFLGRIVDKHGQHPDPQRTVAVTSMPAPTNVGELRSYLGAINWYAKYVPQMHSLRGPLNSLLKKNAKWAWTSKCQQSFDQFKITIQS
jgi:hypothetical protein